MEWWDYVTSFNTLCGSPSDFVDEACIDKVMKDANIDKQKVRGREGGGLERERPS